MLPVDGNRVNVALVMRGEDAPGAGRDGGRVEKIRDQRRRRRLLQRHARCARGRRVFEQGGHTPALPQHPALRIGDGHLDGRRFAPRFLGDPFGLVTGVPVEAQYLDAPAVDRAEIQPLLAPPVDRSGAKPSSVVRTPSFSLPRGASSVS